MASYDIQVGISCQSGIQRAKVVSYDTQVAICCQSGIQRAKVVTYDIQIAICCQSGKLWWGQSGQFWCQSGISMTNWSDAKVASLGQSDQFWCQSDIPKSKRSVLMPKWHPQNKVASSGAKVASPNQSAFFWCKSGIHSPKRPTLMPKWHPQTNVASYGTKVVPNGPATMSKRHEKVEFHMCLPLKICFTGTWTWPNCKEIYPGALMDKRRPGEIPWDAYGRICIRKKWWTRPKAINSCQYVIWWFVLKRG